MITEKDFTDKAVAIDEIVKFIQNSSKEEASLKQIVQRCEKQQQDIMHEIEFTIISRKKAVQLVKQLKQLRLERRMAKNMLKYVEPYAQQSRAKTTNSSNLVVLANKTREIKEELESLVYVPRDENSDISIDKTQHFEIMQEADQKYKVTRRR